MSGSSGDWETDSDQEPYMFEDESEDDSEDESIDEDESIFDETDDDEDEDETDEDGSQGFREPVHVHTQTQQLEPVHVHTQTLPPRWIELQELLIEDAEILIKSDPECTVHRLSALQEALAKILKKAEQAVALQNVLDENPEFLCSVSKRLMQDPVVTIPDVYPENEGECQTYDRECIEEHIKKRKTANLEITDPLTNKRIKPTVFPNVALRQVIARTLDKKEVSLGSFRDADL